MKAGQELLQLWNKDLQAQLRLTESDGMAARMRSQEVCLTADMAKREVDRLRPLHLKKLVSVERLDQAKTESLAKAAACQAAKAIEGVNEAQVAVAWAVLERAILTAHFDGVVAEVTGGSRDALAIGYPDTAGGGSDRLQLCLCERAH